MNNFDLFVAHTICPFLIIDANEVHVGHGGPSIQKMKADTQWPSGPRCAPTPPLVHVLSNPMEERKKLTTTKSVTFQAKQIAIKTSVSITVFLRYVG